MTAAETVRTLTWHERSSDMTRVTRPYFRPGSNDGYHPGKQSADKYHCTFAAHT